MFNGEIKKEKAEEVEDGTSGRVRTGTV
jgi:hypothetical protein